MSPDSQRPQRRSIRYKGYDYASGGAYFVTVCTKDRLLILENDVVCSIVTDVWYALPNWFPTIALDEFVVMPNHVHFLVWLGVMDERYGDGGRGQAPPLRGGSGSRRYGYELPMCEKPQMQPALGDVVGGWKSLCFLVYRRWAKTNAPNQRAKFWQRNYYDRIVRNERGLTAIRDYIRANPDRWDHDPDNIHNVDGLPEPESIDDYMSDVQRFNNR